MTPSKEVQAKLQACDPEVQEYVRALQTAYAQLQKEAVKLKAKKMANESRIEALEKELGENTEAFTASGKKGIEGHLTHEAILAAVAALPGAEEKK